MSLNPIALGEQVVEQFHRYLMTYFPIADHRIEEQVRAALRVGPAGQRRLINGPYIQLNRPFQDGPRLESFVADHQLHPALPGVFRHLDTLHMHQAMAVEALQKNRNLIVATGTGSGKTEAFLLPIINHCLRLRDEDAPPGVAAVLVYPMNALVNDQLQRLRHLLAGTGIPFARYTGETPPQSVDNLPRLDQMREYTPQELEAHQAGRELPLPYEERYSRSEIRAEHPRILLTNYNQLEYLLLRHEDIDLFDGAPLRYLVMDEVHTYTGALGSEVACLLRRLRYLTGKRPDEVLCVGTSATVQDPSNRIDGATAVRNFAHRLFGIAEDSIEVVEEQYRGLRTLPGDAYEPQVPEDPQAALAEVLAACREVHLQDEVTRLPDEVLQAAERLCGRLAAPGEDNRSRLFDLLAANQLVRHLERAHDAPRLLEETLQGLRQMTSRGDASRDDLIAELLAYLTLGALAERDDEPLLRPKLHYFVQGYQGITVSFEPEDMSAEGSPLVPRVHFAHEPDGTDLGLRLPLLLCRGCGQHYFRAIVGQPTAADSDGAAAGYRPVRIADEREEWENDENVWYLTDRLVTEDEDEQVERQSYFMCRYCGALHDRQHRNCLHDKCKRVGPLVEIIAFEGEPKTCRACGAPNWTVARTISGTRSSVVQDVMILAQSLLSVMPEPSMRKLLIFADNRQDAAFQAGWMKARSRRVWLRHLLYKTLAEDPSRAWTIESLAPQLYERAEAHGILETKKLDYEDECKRIRWFLLQEFASLRERRGSLETLGLAVVEYDGLDEDADPAFFDRWAEVLGLSRMEIVATIRLLLDYNRRRGVLSDSLLAHWWAYRDVQVRRGIVEIPDHWAPSALALNKPGAGQIVRGLLASNGRASAQVLVAKSVRAHPERRDEFLKELWDWLTDPERRLLVTVRLTKRGHRGAEPIAGLGTTWQVNEQRTRIRHTSERHVCSVCRRAQAVALPDGRCPEYRCTGTTSLQSPDSEHFAVSQYTVLPFVPLRPREHTAQIATEDRKQVEQQFQQEDGEVNCIVCSPTLELGVDIGKLEMVAMRNVPPTPANYAQRAGRAGRKHRIAVVFAYCGGSQHDRYFFDAPTEMITGAIRVPGFTLQNRPLIRKHVQSAVLTELRRIALPDERAQLEQAFPHYIWQYFATLQENANGETHPRYLPEPPTFPELQRMISAHLYEIMPALRRIFTENWPDEDGAAVAEQELEAIAAGAGVRLETHVGILHRRVLAYRDEVTKLARREMSMDLTEKEKSARRRYQTALDSLKAPSQQNYALAYLSVDGYLPGYAMARESCTATCIDPFKEFSRPAAVALREFAPTGQIYADGNVFRVTRIKLHDPWEKTSEDSPYEATRRFCIEPDNGRLLDPATRTHEGGAGGESLWSVSLAGVDLDTREAIGDVRENRLHVGYDVRPMLLAEHGGGWDAKVGDHSLRYFRRHRIRLVNLGPLGSTVESAEGGFVVCPICGAVRSPHASAAELQKFVDTHRKQCSASEVQHQALHVEFAADLLLLGPFAKRADAINAMTGILVGAKQVLDMGDSELEGLVLPEASDTHCVLLYDPMPGGSGFLPQLRRYWMTICQKGCEVIQSCSGCEEDEACYGCLKTYRNQQYHEELSRAVACRLLEELATEIVETNEVPPVVVERTESLPDTESDAEQLLEALLSNHSFPLPAERQYRVDLGGGDVTVADFAYPAEKVLVYVDGMSERIHGNPQQRLKDSILRAKASKAGFQLSVISAEGLHDPTGIAAFLNELAIYLDKADLILDQP